MNLFLLAGIIIAAAAVACGMLWLARRNPMNERFSSQLGEHGRAFDFLGITFAILLGFLVLQAYDSYNEAKRGAEQEAQALLELSRTSATFTPQEHERLEGTLVCYGRAVIEQGWPAMRDGSDAPVVNEWGRRFRDAAFELRVHSKVQEAAFRQLLEEQDGRIEGRRVRLAEAVRVTPPPMWFVLIFGALLTVGWIVLGANRRGSFTVQACAVASVAAMATATLLLVWFLDHPFTGQSGSITPIEMREVLRIIEEESHAEGIEVTHPCTETWRPPVRPSFPRVWARAAPRLAPIAPNHEGAVRRAPVARIGAGIRAAPIRTRTNAIIRTVISSAPVPTGSRKTRMPPTIAVRLAVTEVMAITSTPGPI